MNSSRNTEPIGTLKKHAGPAPFNLFDTVSHVSGNATGVVRTMYAKSGETWLVDVEINPGHIVYSSPASNWKRISKEEDNLG